MTQSSSVLGVRARVERWPMLYPFRITGYEFTDSEVLVVEIERDGVCGRGEACGVYYKGDTPEQALRQVEGLREELRGVNRDSLLTLLPPGGARNAIDAALWDLEAKERATPVWQLAGLEKPHPVVTTYTLGADDAGKMAERARDFGGARALKLKLDGSAADAERVRAVRAARPDVWMAVDANQGFTPESLELLMPVLIEAKVQLIEQPFPVGREADMEDVRSPIPMAADESVQSIEDLAPLEGRFDVVNIKLDKCGGLTHALEMEEEARRLGLRVMVGNMSGTSLGMAPGFILGQLCDVTDLDGPLLLAKDRVPGAVYKDGSIWCPGELWGGGVR